MKICSSYLALDYEGNYFCLSLYNVNNVKIDEKLKKNALISIVHPEVKEVVFEGLNYISVQLFGLKRFASISSLFKLLRKLSLVKCSQFKITLRIGQLLTIASITLPP